MVSYNLHPDGTTPFFSGLSEIKTENLLEAVLEYHRRGIPVTPLHHKRPVLKNWQERKLSESELPYYFAEGHNVGIVLGGPAGLVDVDLDHPVSVTVADFLFPETVKSGREKNPRSHCWFICNPVPASRRFSLSSSMAERLKIEPEEMTLVELRSTGQQTMVPPSIHPEDGDCCFWYPGEICKINGAVLAELVLDVAIATLLALNVPLGSRQHFIVHAAGHLIRLVGRDRAKTIVGAASEVIDDEEHAERMLAVRDFLWGLSSTKTAISMATEVELERLAPGVPGLVTRWCRRNRPNYRGEV